MAQTLNASFSSSSTRRPIALVVATQMLPQPSVRLVLESGQFRMAGKSRGLSHPATRAASPRLGLRRGSSVGSALRRRLRSVHQQVRFKFTAFSCEPILRQPAQQVLQVAIQATIRPGIRTQPALHFCHPLFQRRLSTNMAFKKIEVSSAGRPWGSELRSLP